MKRCEVCEHSLEVAGGADNITACQRKDCPYEAKCRKCVRGIGDPPQDCAWPDCAVITRKET